MQPFWWFKAPAVPPITKWITDGDFEVNPSDPYTWDTDTSTWLELDAANHTVGGAYGMYLTGWGFTGYFEQDILTLKGQACPVNDITVLDIWYKENSYSIETDNYFDVIVTYSDDTEQTVSILKEKDYEWHNAGLTVLAALTAGKSITKIRLQKTWPRDGDSLTFIDDVRISTG
jgi:hypothetical protein